jgi:hypothetical protein
MDRVYRAVAWQRVDHIRYIILGIGDIAPLYVTSTLDEGEWSAARPGRLTPRGRDPGTHWVGGLMGPRAVMEATEKRKIFPLPELEPRPSNP